MHNIEHERRPTNTPKPTSTLSNLSGLLRWVHCLKPRLFAAGYAYVCMCVDAKRSSQLYPIGVWQFWLLSNFMDRKMGRQLCNWKQRSKMVKEHSEEYFEDQ